MVLNGSPPRTRLDLRLQDSLGGDLLATISEEGFSSDLLELVWRSGAELRAELGLGVLNPEQEAVARAALPATPEAARFYAEGLDKLRVFDALGARAALERAVAEDGRHALARAALATAWSMSGYRLRAQEHAGAALELAKNLGREDQLLVEGRYREAALEWAEVAEVYRTLFGFFPDNLDYGLRLVSALTSAGNGKEAMAVVDRLRNSPLPDGESPRIDVAEARAAGSLSDFQRQRELAALAATKAERAGGRLLVAAARMMEGNALAGMGDLSRARAAFESARAVYEESRITFQEIGNRSSLAHALSRLGDLDLIEGDLAAAKTAHEEALSLRQQLGEKGGAADSHLALAQIALHQNDPGSAERTARAAADAFRAATRSGNEASAMAVLARSFLMQGKVAESADAIRRAGELASASEDIAVRLSVGITGASIQAARGDAVNAIRDLQRIISETRSAGMVRLELEARLALAEAEILTGRVKAGRTRIETLEREASGRGYKYIADRAAAIHRGVSRLRVYKK